MKIFGIICLVIVIIFALMWLCRRILIALRYAGTTGEIVDVRNVVPLVDKRQVYKGKRYKYTLCQYQGNVYVTVRFITRGGEELTRRYSLSEPFYLKINEHRRIVPQYTSFFPQWQTGRRIRVFYNRKDTGEMFVGRVLRFS